MLLPLFFDDTTEITPNKLSMIKDMHMKRIDIADEIFVINKGGYIGSSTESEIKYANKMGKKVVYYEHIK